MRMTEWGLLKITRRSNPKLHRVNRRMEEAAQRYFADFSAEQTAGGLTICGRSHYLR
jgi:hypothetical protein